MTTLVVALVVMAILVVALSVTLCRGKQSGRGGTLDFTSRGARGAFTHATDASRQRRLTRCTTTSHYFATNASKCQCGAWSR